MVRLYGKFFYYMCGWAYAWGSVCCFPKKRTTILRHHGCCSSTRAVFLLSILTLTVVKRQQFFLPVGYVGHLIVRRCVLAALSWSWTKFNILLQKKANWRVKKSWWLAFCCLNKNALLFFSAFLKHFKILFDMKKQNLSFWMGGGSNIEFSPHQLFLLSVNYSWALFRSNGDSYINIFFQILPVLILLC